MTGSTLASQMRALVLAEFGRISVEEYPIPAPASGEVLLRVIATGICGSDIHGFTGENGRRHIGQVMGHETVAVVAAYGNGTNPAGLPKVGATVTVNPNLSCGECAYCLKGDTHICAQRRVIGVDQTIRSAFAEFFVAPTNNIVELEPSMPTLLGVLVEPLAVGFHAVNRGRLTNGDSVFIIGSGPIGQATILAARRLGASKIIVSEPDQDRRKIAAQLGAQVIDPTVESVETVVMAHTDGIGVTVSIDAVGISATVATAISSTCRSGTIVLVGMNAQQIEIGAYGITTDERSLVGAFCYSHSEFKSTAKWAAGEPELLSGLITEVVGIDKGPEVFASLAKSTAGASKILVQFSEFHS